MSLFHDPVSVPALNLKAQYQSIRDEIEPVVREILESQMFVLGPEVTRLEAEVADYCGAASGIGCASGSDALLLPLLAIDIGPGDEVITTPYTFFATGGSIWRTGAKPIFVDIEPDTFNIDPVRIEAAITPRTRAIIPVHLFGQVAEMGPIQEIARRHGLTVLEDAAQAIGSAYHGTRAGTLGDVAAFSFYPSKNLGGFGDGGMVTTNQPQLARRITRLRVHGMEPKYHHHEVGFNSRLDAFQAAVLRVKLRHLDAWTTLAGMLPTATATCLLLMVWRKWSACRSSGRAISTSTTSSSSGFRPSSVTRSGTTSLRGRSVRRSTTRSRSTCRSASPRWGINPATSPTPRRLPAKPSPCPFTPS